MEEGKVEISIDEQNKIRILDPEVYKESEKLKNECLELIKSTAFLSPQKYSPSTKTLRA